MSLRQCDKTYITEILHYDKLHPCRGLFIIYKTLLIRHFWVICYTVLYQFTWRRISSYCNNASNIYIYMYYGFKLNSCPKIDHWTCWILGDADVKINHNSEVSPWTTTKACMEIPQLHSHTEASRMLWSWPTYWFLAVVSPSACVVYELTINMKWQL